VFLDIKLYDIPTTVERAAAAVGRLGVRYLNAHAQGGEVVLRAAVEGFRSTAPSNAALLAVTVLTSDADTSDFTPRLRTALAAGCGGVVCSALELDEIAHVAPAGFVTMVPGIRPAGASHDEQARVATPADAIRGGARVIILGRAVTRAEDPERAAAAIYDEVTHALEI
jgi:orotidine-5'-phosphate decarboxylase